jgi:hypothetical protein
MGNIIKHWDGWAALTLNEEERAIRTAEHDIASRLAALESETGMLVESIGLEAIDVSRVCDDAPVMKMRVNVELFRRLGHEQGTS